MSPPAGKKPIWKRWWVLAIVAVVAVSAISTATKNRAVDKQATNSTAGQLTLGPAPTEASTSAEDKAAASSPAPVTTVPPPPTPRAAPAPEVIGFGDGTYRLGSDVAAGTYRSAGTGLCYWARLSGFSGEFSDIIGNGNSGLEIVSIAKSDAGFTTQGCGDWVPVKATFPDAPARSFGDGTFQVGKHIAPGTYRANGAPSDLCYWARLSNFSQSGISGIIANGNSPTIVEIRPSDTGFTSSGCGEWTR